MSNEPMVLFQVKITPQLREALRTRAKSLGLRMSDLGRWALAREAQLGQDVPELTHEDLVHLKRIAQRVHEELARAKAGSAVWEAMRFILSSPIEKAQEESTWESLGDYIDYPEPDQTYGAAD